MRRFSGRIRPSDLRLHLTHPTNTHSAVFKCGFCVVVSAQPLCTPPVSTSNSEAYLGTLGLKPPPLPVQLNANIHQSPLHSPLSSSLLCARACRTVGLIRPLAFHGGQADKHGSRNAKQIAADQMSAHLSSPCTARPSPHSQEVKGALRSELPLQHTHTHTHTESFITCV